MQDNFTNIDEQFTNRGWGEMEKLLDKELPVVNGVKKKKRRLIFWFWLLGILLGGVIGAWGSYAYFTKTEEVEVPHNLPIAENSTNIKTNHPITEAAKIEAKEFENEQAASVTKSNERTGLIASIERKIESTSTIFEKQKIQKSDNLNIVDHTTNNKGIENITVEPATPITKEEKGIALENLSNIYPIEVLNINSIGTSEKEITPHLVSVEIEPMKSFSNWSMRQLNHFHENTAGVSLGAAYEQKIDDHLSLEIGGHFSHLRYFQELGGAGISPTNESSPLAGAADPEYYLDTGNSVFANFDDQLSPTGVANLQAGSSATVFPDKMNLSYLNLPILVNYQLAPRFNIHGGFTASALLIAATGYTQGGLLNKDANLDADRFLADNFSSDLSTVDKLKLNQFDVAGNIGFRYTAFRGFELGLGYHHGALNFMKNASVKKYNRFFTLSLSYQLNKKVK